MTRLKILITTICIVIMVTSCSQKPNDALITDTLVPDEDYNLEVQKEEDTEEVPEPTPTLEPTPTPEPTFASKEDVYAAEVLRLVNIQRLERGLSELKTTKALRNAADLRAAEIVTLFDHQRPDEKEFYTVLEEFGVSFMAAGENIAHRHSSPKEVVSAWMDSEGHKENIINDSFNKMGVGLYMDEEGYIAWVQLFTD